MFNNIILSDIKSGFFHVFTDMQDKYLTSILLKYTWSHGHLGAALDTSWSTGDQNKPRRGPESLCAKNNIFGPVLMASREPFLAEFDRVKV